MRHAEIQCWPREEEGPQAKRGRLRLSKWSGDRLLPETSLPAAPPPRPPPSLSSGLLPHQLSERLLLYRPGQWLSRDFANNKRSLQRILYDTIQGPPALPPIAFLSFLKKSLI